MKSGFQVAMLLEYTSGGTALNLGLFFSACIVCLFFLLVLLIIVLIVLLLVVCLGGGVPLRSTMRVFA